MQRRVPLIFCLLLLALTLAAALAPASPADSPYRGDADRAVANYNRTCKTCHGAEGKGDGVMAQYLDPHPKDLTDRDYMKSRSDEELFKAIKEGGASVGLSDKMAPWKSLLSDQEIKDLVALVRRFSKT